MWVQERERAWDSSALSLQNAFLSFEWERMRERWRVSLTVWCHVNFSLAMYIFYGQGAVGPSVGMCVCVSGKCRPVFDERLCEHDYAMRITNPLWLMQQIAHFLQIWQTERGEREWSLLLHLHPEIWVVSHRPNWSHSGSAIDLLIKYRLNGESSYYMEDLTCLS